MLSLSKNVMGNLVSRIILLVYKINLTVVISKNKIFHHQMDRETVNGSLDLFILECSYPSRFYILIIWDVEPLV
jgi:hypothetical protein